jgi:hypothetical protein
MQQIQIETDCIQVVQGVEGKVRNNREFGVIIDKCKSLLCHFQNCRVSYVRRQANRVAHELAQAARLYVSPQVFESCPPCIETTVMNEMN